MCKLSKKQGAGLSYPAGRSIAYRRTFPYISASPGRILSIILSAFPAGHRPFLRTVALGRIFDELLHKNRAEIFRYAASAFGLLGFAMGLMHLIINPLSGITLAVDIAFALFALVWTIFIYLTTVSKKGARAALWSLSICSAASLALFCAAFVLDVYNGFIYLPPTPFSFTPLCCLWKRWACSRLLYTPSMKACPVCAHSIKSPPLPRRP